jgi:poly-gamma-glutamate synthesis protein (capsule biosynthesis protein)
VIAALRQPDDITVASLHWGGNWGYRIPPEQRSFAHTLVDAGGVDIVHGHSSHHARPVEMYNDKLIIYGCGDFVTDYEGIGGHERYRPWLAPMYFVTVSPVSRQIERLEIFPLRMRRLQLSEASRDDRTWFGAMMNRISRGFGTSFKPRNGKLSATRPRH